MTSTGQFADVVLPAATWYEKCDLSCTDLHPFVHAFNAAIDPPWEARSDWDAFSDLARVFSAARGQDTSACATTSWPRRSRTTPRRSLAALRRGQRLGARRGRADPRQDDAHPDRGRARLRRHLRQAHQPRSAGRVGSASARRASPGDPTPRSPGWPPQTAVVRGGVGAGRPSPRARRAGRRDDPRALGNDQRALAHRGFKTLERRVGSRSPTSSTASATRTSLVRRAGATAEDPHQSRVVGQRGRRPPVQRLYDQRRAPQALAYPHWPHALLLRSRVDGRARRAAAGLSPAAQHARALPGKLRARRRDDRLALPHAALEVVDPLRVPGEPDHAHAVSRRPGALAGPRRRRPDRRRRQRLGRTVEPQRCARLPRRGLAAHAARASATSTTPRTGTCRHRAPR